MKQSELIPDFVVYTDGSCNNMSPFGEGGAAFVMLDSNGNTVKTWSHGYLDTTNNRMELKAIHMALSSIPDGSNVLIKTDSKYCIKILDKESQSLPYANKDIVKICFESINCLRNVVFEWIKGHDGNEFNELADSLANEKMMEVREKFRIPAYGYKEYKQPFTESEKLRLQRFNKWMGENKDSFNYCDYTPF